MDEKKSDDRAKSRDQAAGKRSFVELEGRITRHSGIGPEQAGTLNRRLMLELIRRSGGMSRAELSRETGLTAQATSKIVARLTEAGFLTEVARRTGGQGYPSRVYAIDPGGAYSLGATIEADQLTVVMLDLAGRIIAQNMTRLKDTRPDSVFGAIRDIVEAQIRTTGVARSVVVGFGLGIPGRYDARHAMLIPPSFNPDWQEVPVAKRLQDGLDMPVFWDNDANAAAIGEHFRGAGMQFQDMLYLHIGRGIGSGLILSGDVYRGGEGNAGEIGRVPVLLPHLSSEPLRLSQVASLKALERRLQDSASPLDDVQDIADRLRAGDRNIRAWITDASDAIAQALRVITYALDVEAVVMGGGLPNKVIDEILRGVLINLEAGLYRWNRVPSVIRGTAGPAAGALGAATLPMHAVFAARL